MARLEMARADWLLRSVNDLVSRMDRGSNRDHQKLITMLIGHEMRLRSASRSEQRTLAAGDGAGDGSAGSPGWIQAARGRRVEAVRRVNLDQDLAIVNRYLGDGVTSQRQLSPEVAEPNASERIRTLGRPISLLGVLPGVDVPPAKISLVVESGPWRATANEPASRMIVALLVLMAIGLLTTGWRQGVQNEYAGAIDVAWSGRLSRRAAGTGGRGGWGDAGVQEKAYRGLGMKADLLPERACR